MDREKPEPLVLTKYFHDVVVTAEIETVLISTTRKQWRLICLCQNHPLTAKLHDVRQNDAKSTRITYLSNNANKLSQ